MQALGICSHYHLEERNVFCVLVTDSREELLLKPWGVGSTGLLHCITLWGMIVEMGETEQYAGYGFLIRGLKKIQLLFGPN